MGIGSEKRGKDFRKRYLSKLGRNPAACSDYNIQRADGITYHPWNQYRQGDAWFKVYTPPILMYHSDPSASLFVLGRMKIAS